MAMPSFNTEQPMTELYFSSVTRDAVVRVDISKIVYFESDGNYTFIVTISSFKPSIGLNLVGVKRELFCVVMLGLTNVNMNIYTL